MKIVVFGVGKFYKNRKKQLMSYPDIEIVIFMDNDKSMWGKTIDGIQIVSPQKIREIDYDVILIMSTYAEEIYEQLMNMEVTRLKIRSWEAFCAEMISGTKKKFPGKDDNKKGEGKILIISTSLNYNGGSLAALYAVMTMKNRGYNAILAAPAGDAGFITETTEKGITVYICPSLPYACDMKWIKQFDLVIVNVFQMIQSAINLSLECPTLWWIHEPSLVFNYTRSSYWNCVPEKDLTDINIYAVSRIPKENFNRYYPDRIQKILHYGIPDMNYKDSMHNEKKEKIVFAIIGNVEVRKAQDIFCKAVEKLDNKEQAEFWIIGNYGQDAFGEEIFRMSTKISSIKMFGLITREGIYSIFPQIDVVVCTSREDPLPIVMTEGMMFGKICVTTDATGTADYIQSGKNGFIIPSEDVDALKERMEWIINNKDKLEVIGRNARKTYEKYFSMDVFGENLDNAILETKREWHLKRR